MLSAAMNERLTRVGPGTPGGELMRRYWIPIAPTSQLLDNPVKKVRILCEDLVLYKDKSGKLGLVGDRCLHRGVDLMYGIPDQCGLRCPYHGWLFDETGACTERPMEARPSLEITQKLAAYPVQELGGLVFAYMGPLPAPELPRWDLFVWPNAIRQIGLMHIDCNWLQCHENTGDPTHSAWAHGRMFEYVLQQQGRLEDVEKLKEHTLHTRLAVGVGIKDLYARPTDHGFRKGVNYSKDLGAESDGSREHSGVIFPFYTQTGKTGAARSEYQIRVPIDDTHTYHICYTVYAAPEAVAAPKQDVVPWYQPPTRDANGQPVLDYVLAQDALVWYAQGPIADRTKELLGRTDIPILLLRKQLDEQMKIVEQGRDPMNTFRVPHEIVYGSGQAPDMSQQSKLLRHDFRRLYHRGFANDDADRYGPIIEMVKDLHRRIEEYELAREGDLTPAE